MSSKDKTVIPHKNNIKRKLPEIILIVSALLLGILIVVLVAGNKTHTVIEPERKITGSYPMPSELLETDKVTYFAYMEIPDMIFKKMEGVSFQEDCPVTREDLRYLKVLYWGTDGRPHQGEMIVNKAIAEDLADIFYELYKAVYPIESIAMIDSYGGNDEVSMSNNNTSCFNGRKIAGTDKWSLHAYGMAVDINPLYNPCVMADGTILPIAGEAYADRSGNFLYKIDENDYAYRLFTSHGFTWGGSWNGMSDYQHFEKNLNTVS